MVDWFKWFRREQKIPTIDYNDLPNAYTGQTGFSDYNWSTWDGGKFEGGFGPTQLWEVDYWTLRARSDQLFRDNLYAEGLIKRLVNNEINTGLTPEARPDEKILGLEEESLNDWTDNVENRFDLWGNSPRVCDWEQQNTLSQLQKIARYEALIGGDVLVILRQNPKTQLPSVQLIRGSRVTSPLSINEIKEGHKIRDGVEFDSAGRVAAYHIYKDDGEYQRVPAIGPRTGRRMAWLVFGEKTRAGDVRGMPLLGNIMQSLKEIDRYRDSVQRKAVINSLLAMFIKKTEEKMGTLPIGNAARNKASASITDSTTGGVPRKFNFGSFNPGITIDELQVGEEPVLKGGEGTDVNYGPFEKSIIQAVAWSKGVPPEILTLAFSNNYSASQAAINEFKIYLNMVWTDIGSQLMQPIYNEWLISEALKGAIKAPGLLEAWRDDAQHDKYAAWVAADWYGSIKPSTDMVKQAKGSEILINQGWSTNAREARVITGTKFNQNIKRIKRENEMKREAGLPEYQIPETPEEENNDKED